MIIPSTGKKSDTEFVYLVVGDKGTIYTGHATDPRLAVHRHRTKEVPGQYDAKKLVYIGALPNREAARKRTREIKGWTRKQKIELINSSNPEWRNLAV